MFRLNKVSYILGKNAITIISVFREYRFNVFALFWQYYSAPWDISTLWIYNLAILFFILVNVVGFFCNIFVGFFSFSRLGNGCNSICRKMFATKLKCRLKTKTKAKSICDEFYKMKISYLNKIKYYWKIVPQTDNCVYVHCT